LEGREDESDQGQRRGEMKKSTGSTNRSRTLKRGTGCTENAYLSGNEDATVPRGTKKAYKRKAWAIQRDEVCRKM